MTEQEVAIKSQILDWFDKSHQPVKKRGKLSAGIDRLLQQITERDDWSESMTVLLGNTTAPKFNVSSRNWHAVACGKGLAVSTFVPGWGFGWRRAFKDDYVYDVLSWLIHYYRQYIHRSYVAKVLMIAWEREQVVLHPFGNRMQSHRYGAVTPPAKAKTALTAAVRDLPQDWDKLDTAPQSRSKWIRRNTLDPAIHQAVFHFLRGRALISAGFNLEASIAFDCVLQSLQVLAWKNAVGDPRRIRSDLVTTLGLSKEDGDLATHLYFLRNEFGAHAGGWRWWDSGEYTDNETIERISLMALRVLTSAADAEPDVRRVSISLEPWSAWFLQTFSLLFEANWFRPDS